MSNDIKERIKQKSAILDRRYADNLRKLWYRVSEQGINPADVQSFMWKEDFITPEVQATIDVAKSKGKKYPYTDFFNCVLMKKKVETDETVLIQLVPPLQKPQTTPEKKLQRRIRGLVPRGMIANDPIADEVAESPAPNVSAKRLALLRQFNKKNKKRAA